MRSGLADHFFIWNGLQRILTLFKMADTAKEKKPDLGLLEEDDEFEEFPAEGKMLFTICKAYWSSRQNLKKLTIHFMVEFWLLKISWIMEEHFLVETMLHRSTSKIYHIWRNAQLKSKHWLLKFRCHLS